MRLRIINGKFVQEGFNGPRTIDGFADDLLNAVIHPKKSSVIIITVLAAILGFLYIYAEPYLKEYDNLKKEDEDTIIRNQKIISQLKDDILEEEYNYYSRRYGELPEQEKKDWLEHHVYIVQEYVDYMNKSFSKRYPKVDINKIIGRIFYQEYCIKFLRKILALPKK